MQQIATFNNYSLQQISDAYNGLIDNIKLLDGSFNKPKVSRFRSKPEGIERVMGLIGVLVLKYGLFMNMCQFASVPGGKTEKPEPVKQERPKQRKIIIEKKKPPIRESAQALRNQNGYTGTRVDSKLLMPFNSYTEDERLHRKQQILGMLEQGPITISDIAKSLSISNRNVSTVFTNLRKQGYRIIVTRLNKSDFLAELI